ncbi:hypothetical protein JMJ35_006624 [Cladonia borealis]|uniref:Uncharacterized protein n=1 Tax=Cladonia borealis TaxID=184061 RepID=A0AA39QXI7_9LECA|nr:hypothetical protein JMJ35_006624 [Cladonia borealis]
MLLAAKHAVDEMADEANATLTKAEEAFAAWIDKAQKDLDAKKADIVAESQRPKRNVEHAKESFDNFISDLEAQLTSVEQHMNNAIGAAEKDLTDAQADWDGKIDDAEQALSIAEGSLQSAQNSANSLNGDLNRERQAYNEDGFFAKVGKAAVVAGLEAEQGAREAAVGVAEGLVEAARVTVDGPLYHAAQGLVSDAQTGLQSIRGQAPGRLVAQGGVGHKGVRQSGEGHTEHRPKRA